MARNYSSTVQPKTLAVSITDVSATTITLNNVTGLPAVPYILVINPDTASEEIVLVTSVSGSVLTVTRAVDGTTATTHTVGNTVKHMIVGTDLQIVHDHFSNDNTTSGTAHGTTGGVVGRTSAQTLTTKTIALGSNTITGTKAEFNAAMTDADFVTIAGTETLAAKTLTAPTITSPTITSPTISGTITGAVVTSANIVDATITGADIASETITSANILDGTIVNADINASAAIAATKLTGTTAQFNTALSDGDFATLAGTETLTNKTLTSPVINGTVTGTAGFDAWTVYTPTWGSNGTQPTLNNGTIGGAYTQIGKVVHFRLSLTIGSSSSLGTGTRYTFTLPVTGNAIYPMATGFYFDSSQNNWYPIWARVTTTAIDTMWIEPGPNGLTSGTLGATLPVVPNTGDFYFLNGTYEAA